MKLVSADVQKMYCVPLFSRFFPGRPLGSDEFVGSLEQKLGRTLVRQKPGRKPKKKEEDK